MRQPLHKKIMLTLLLAVAAMLLLYFLVGRGLWAAYTGLTGEIAELQLLIAAAMPVADSLEREREALRLARMELAEYDHYFNNRLDEGLYLNEVGNEAIKHGVIVNEIQLGTVRVLTTHLERPVHITVTGDYRDVLGYLQRLTEIARHTEITEMAVRDAYVPPVRSSSRAETVEDQHNIQAPAKGMVVAKVLLVVSTGLEAESKQSPSGLEQMTMGRPNSFIQSVPARPFP